MTELRDPCPRSFYTVLDRVIEEASRSRFFKISEPLGWFVAIIEK